MRATSGGSRTFNKTFYRVCQSILWCMGRVLWRVRWVGLENVPHSGAFIIASTHESFLDPLMVGAPIAPVRFLARRTLFLSRGRRSRLRTWLGGAVGMVELDLEGVGTEGIRRILDVLAEGSPILLFPEGTRSQDGEVQAFRAGVGMLALKSGAPVVPVSVDGTRKVWGRGRSLPRLIGGPIRIVYGEPTVFERPAKARDVAARVRDRILDLRGPDRSSAPRDGGRGHEVAGGSSSP